MHPDMKGRSEGMMFLKKGVTASKSSRHGINSRSSNGSKIIGVNYHMTGVLWTLRFLGVQGFKVNKKYRKPG